MSRAGYITDGDYDPWACFKWKGQVASAIRGKRGQRLLLDLYKALEALPVKELVPNQLETPEGSVCALGALGKAKGLDMMAFDPYNYDALSDIFDAASPLIREIEFENDAGGAYAESPAERYERMKQWIADHILPVPIEE